MSGFREISTKTLLHLIGPGLAVVSFRVSNGSWSFPGIQPETLIWSMIAYVVGEHLSRLIETALNRKRFIDSHDSTCDLIRATSKNFEAYVGSLGKVSYVDDDEFGRRTAESIRSASHVRNAYIGLKDVSGSKTQRQDLILGYYQQVLDKGVGTTWQDVVGIGELLDGRYEELHRRIGRKTPGSHQLFVLTSQAPVINFMLLAPAGGQFQEVYFGWVRNTSSEIDRFYSSDHRIVSMFLNYFESLTKAKDRVVELTLDYGVKEGRLFATSIFHRIAGHWLSVSDGNASARNYATITIEYDDEWGISGEVFNVATSRLLYRFRSEMCLIVKNSLYFRYEDIDQFGDPISSGIGMYAVGEMESTLVGYYTRSKAGSRSRSCFGVSAVKLTGDRRHDPASIRNTLRSAFGIEPGRDDGDPKRAQATSGEKGGDGAHDDAVVAEPAEEA
jgi:hypothetical protein